MARGGKREGAGRPKTGVNTRVLTVRMSVKLWEAIQLREPDAYQSTNDMVVKVLEREFLRKR